MSYGIEYNQAVFFVPDVSIPEGKRYFLFIREGDNNLWESGTNTRVKDWYYKVSGPVGELWKTIGYRAGVVFGGGLQKAKGWTETGYFTIDEYVAKYRSRIKNAKPLATMLDQFSVAVTIYLRDHFLCEKDQAHEAALRAFIEKYRMELWMPDYYDKGLIGYRHTIQTAEELEDFLIHLPQQWRKDFRVKYDLGKQRPYRRLY